MKPNTGHPVATVARELGINEATLGRWVHDFRARPLRAREGRAHASLGQITPLAFELQYPQQIADPQEAA